MSYEDELPAERISGLLCKIHDNFKLGKKRRAALVRAAYKILVGAQLESIENDPSNVVPSLIDDAMTLLRMAIENNHIPKKPKN